MQYNYDDDKYDDDNYNEDRGKHYIIYSYHFFKAK